MKKSEQIMEIMREFCEEKGITDGVIDTHEMAGWALDKKLYKPSFKDEVQITAEYFSRAMREEMRTSPSGKRYRALHAVKEKKGEKQKTLWADLDNQNVPIRHFEKAFSQRRQQIVGDCFQLKTDVDVCNEKRGSEIPLILDFTDDVAEAEYMRDNKDVA